MVEVKIAPHESFEAALRRFKKKCDDTGVIAEIRRREFYEKPSERRKRKEKAARKRWLRIAKRFEE